MLQIVRLATENNTINLLEIEDLVGFVISGVLQTITVVFLLFIAPAGGSNAAEQSLTLT